MHSTSNHTLVITYDGQQWQATDADNNMMILSQPDDELLPDLPDGAIVGKLILPIEQLLNRTFRLPFSNPKFIDQDILSQELEECSSEKSESWWLSWRAGQSSDGVSGIMIGLQERLRQQIDNHDSWRHIKTIESDIWTRLQHQLNDKSEVLQMKHVHESNTPPFSNIAVFDTDNNGLFFGVWQCADENNKQAYWVAMRRLNWHAESESSHPSSSLIENIKRSLHSMGWQDDSIAIGSLCESLHTALNCSTWHGDLYQADELPSRHNATIAAASTSTLNLRHGRWRSDSHISQIKPWYRSFTLAACIILLWSGSLIWQNNQLEQQLFMQQQRVINAFHKGLPNEKVMIDALAQLQKAAGKNTASMKNSRNLASQWLQHMQAINRVYQKTPWMMKNISFKNGRMTMTGQSKDLQSMNKIHQAIQSETGKKVEIQDTDLSGNQVKFKLVWL